jgi:DNA-binding response OmpR family regulator
MMACASNANECRSEKWGECVAETTDNGKLIAIVEDDANIAALLHDFLERAGHWRLHLFTDGQTARDQLPDLGADLILLDIGLPNLDGASLYRILRGHSKTRHIPIVVITAIHDWQLHRLGLQSGLLLRKPFKFQELLGIIQALLPEES